MSILGRTKASRLVASLRERQGLVSSITSSLSAMEGVGLVMITAQLEPDHLARAESEILAEIQRVRDERRDAESSSSAPSPRRRSSTSSRPRPRRAGPAPGARPRRSGGWRKSSLYVERVRTVTAAQMQSVARRYLDPERYVRVALLPPAR